MLLSNLNPNWDPNILKDRNTFNNTAKISRFVDPVTLRGGVILPHSSRVLFESDIDTKIKETKSQIDYLSNAQSHRNTHGGKRFRARQISLRDQLDSCSKRLLLLTSAKEVFVELDKEAFSVKDLIKSLYVKKSKPTFVQSNLKESLIEHFAMSIKMPDIIKPLRISVESQIANIADEALRLAMEARIANIEDNKPLRFEPLKLAMESQIANIASQALGPNSPLAKFYTELKKAA